MSGKSKVAILCLPILLFAWPRVLEAEVETQGAWFVASPTFFSTSGSGTYYSPTVIERNGYAFLFTQGGQFSSSTSPVSWCAGDAITLWRTPLTHSAMRQAFTPLRRVSRCDSSGTSVYHWTMTSAFESTSSDNIYIVAERQHLISGQQQSISLWLLEGSFNTTQTDVPTWQHHKLFELSNTNPRINSVVFAPDTTRTALNDGYDHELYRGFARRIHFKVIEIRMDISQKYCDLGTSSAVDICAEIEMKQGGNWRKIQSGQLDFAPDTLITAFRVDELVQRDGQLQLWLTQIVSGTACPCNQGVQAGRYRWYAVNSSNFSLSGGSPLWSQVRCMPAEPHNYRVGSEVVTLSDGTDYLLSGQNDDAGCSSSAPFVGQDVVTTIIE